ncbi:CheR family methyltransferase [Rhodospirillum rubrum]|uniref:CheR family methyltransferase n=1 Tax=Rhodospirillum rubrum TaxID=1085 RepID=UPI0005AA4EAD|nr:protein-glutamate O-methyltransferase CheR [Rhodospirillum rubrum]QXG79109.1 protein-glutamate O-methyltransferase CheR [Rhodospirillum rubrum]
MTVIRPPTPGKGTLAISDEEYTKFCDFFYRKTGISFQLSKKYYVERRIIDRAIKTGSCDFREYFTFLRFDMSGEEMQVLVNSMTVNETYFFREDYQFNALVANILPAIIKTKRRSMPIRIWSVPCSSGEEPYSIAITILEKWDQADNWDIEIHASDIDSKILAEARAGIFGARSLARVPPAILLKYFTPRSEGSYQICEGLRGSIDFSLVNIIDTKQTKNITGIDVIFCRNLLIYFDDITRRETVEMFYQNMAPGGFVCLGHSESMSRMTSLFIPRKFGDTIVYQKPQE